MLDIFVQLAVIVVSLFICWRIYKVIKANPEIVSKKNISKSFFSMGILALALLGFVFFLVVLLRAG